MSLNLKPRMITDSLMNSGLYELFEEPIYLDEFFTRVCPRKSVASHAFQVKN